jgi:hypothetical protein
MMNAGVFGCNKVLTLKLILMRLRMYKVPQNEEIITKLPEQKKIQHRTLKK